MATMSESRTGGPMAVVGQQYCVPHARNIVVKSKGPFSSVDYVITDTNGGVLFEVQSGFLSPCIMYDAAGRPLLTMQSKKLSWHGRWRVYRGDSKNPNNLLYSIRRSQYLQFKDRWDVFLGSNTTEEICDFKIKEDFFARDCTIYLGDSNIVVAQMIANMGFFGKNTFQVTVSPNVDYAFIASLLVIIAEIHRSRNNNSSASS